MAAEASATLRDIARQAGVSVMTVSRALRNQHNVAATTRGKIQEIARRLGYRPHPLIATLMKLRRSAGPLRLNLSLAYVTSFPKRNGWRSSKIYLDFFEGASAQARRHGYNLEEFWLREPGMTAHRMSQVLYHRNVPGVIVAPLPVAQGHLRLDWDRFASVAIGYSLARPSLHRAANHQFRSMRLTMRRLRRLGYHRIGLALRASYDERVEHHWAGSFLAEQRGFKPDDQVPLLLLRDRDWQITKFAEWYEQNRPEVVVSQHEEIVKWLRQIGARVPNDVGFLHLNCPDSTGRFAGINQNNRAVGATAVDFLVSMIQRNERGVPDISRSILVESFWQDGATLLPRAATEKSRSRQASVGG